jgi:hypothetical protein
MVLADSNDSFDRELARWFGQHGGRWSGTASELLAVLTASAGAGVDSCPQSFRALYSYIDSHRQTLHSLGVDAELREGPPRMISLQPCPVEKSVGESSPDAPATTYGVNPPINLPPLIPANSEKTTEPSSNVVDADRHGFEGGIFKSAGEALFALVEMRMQIREQNLQLESAVDLVVGRTQEITRSCGVAVGILQQDSVVYPARTGLAATLGALDFQPNLFQLCIKTGRTLPLRDAQNHPHVGAACRREGIGSLILVPLFHNRELAGAVEFLFKERRLFSIGDVVDLELIAGVISESLNGAKTKPVENIESHGGDSSGVSSNGKLGVVQVLATSFPNAMAHKHR